MMQKVTKVRRKFTGIIQLKQFLNKKNDKPIIIVTSLTWTRTMYVVHWTYQKNIHKSSIELLSFIKETKRIQEKL